MRIGVDTNVLVYAADMSFPLHEEAREALFVLAEEDRGFITPQNLTEFISTTTKLGMELPAVMDYVETFSEMFRIVYPNHVTLALFVSLVQQREITKARVFDAFLAATYLSNGIDAIYTYNTKDFEKLGAIRVWKP